jgi:Flp pilus assembly protein TadG
MAVARPSLRVLVRGSGRRWRGQRGQVLVLTAVGMVAMCGVAGFAIDVGTWYQAHRKQQAIADAAALAAAGDLPASTSQASSDAQTYAARNGGTASSISYSTEYLPNDTITVQAQVTAPTFFLKALGIGSAKVKATAVARAEVLGAAWGQPRSRSSTPNRNSPGRAVPATRSRLR